MTRADEIRISRPPELGVAPRIRVRPAEAPSTLAGWACPGCGKSMPARRTGGFCVYCGCDLRTGREPMRLVRRRSGAGSIGERAGGMIFRAVAQMAAALILEMVV
ncbi:MAG: hypothetical protein ACYTGB_04265 [Planctomycetota bacterium]